MVTRHRDNDNKIHTTHGFKNDLPVCHPQLSSPTVSTPLGRCTWGLRCVIFLLLAFASGLLIGVSLAFGCGTRAVVISVLVIFPKFWDTFRMVKNVFNKNNIKTERRGRSNNTLLFPLERSARNDTVIQQRCSTGACVYTRSRTHGGIRALELEFATYYGINHPHRRERATAS